MAICDVLNTIYFISACNMHYQFYSGHCITFIPLILQPLILLLCFIGSGYCHEVCTVSSTAHTSNGVELSITCLQCYRSKDHCQAENSSGSPTSPLPLQEYQNTSKANKLSRQKSQQVASIRSTDTKTKVTACDSVLATKAPPRKLCSWGIIWKKKDGENTGVDFRLKNILLRGTPDMNWLKPVCYLCHKPYNPDLMYIHCETCQRKSSLYFKFFCIVLHIFTSFEVRLGFFW